MRLSMFRLAALKGTNVTFPNLCFLQYSSAASTKLELQQADRQWGSAFFAIMKDVRELYLQRMSVFFKL